LTTAALRGEIRTMGFNRRKMEAQRAAAAEKKAAAKRATEAQILEDAGRLIAAWNERQAKRMPTLFDCVLLWESYPPFSFLLSKLSSISTLLGSRRKICQRALFGTWFTWYGIPFSERCRFAASKPRQPKAEGLSPHDDLSQVSVRLGQPALAPT